MAITGSVISQGGLIDLNFASGSLWSGSAGSDHVNEGHINVNLTDSQWLVAGNSELDNLQMNHSLIDMTDANAYSTLTVANLSGNGDFALRTDLAGDGDGDGVNNIGDKVVVNESSAGDYTLFIQNRGSAATTGNEVLTVVETPDGVASTSASVSAALSHIAPVTLSTGLTAWPFSSSPVPCRFRLGQLSRSTTASDASALCSSGSICSSSVRLPLR
ncbi:autotransporter outer membrane beta-barrel domain-containing protein [Pantoea sp. Eser]|nr:autotransporter outer membrane beta-barrel domain-containing protein [Pantoea sp. Eser]